MGSTMATAATRLGHDFTIHAHTAVPEEHGRVPVDGKHVAELGRRLEHGWDVLHDAHRYIRELHNEDFPVLLLPQA